MISILHPTSLGELISGSIKAPDLNLDKDLEAATAVLRVHYFLFRIVTTSQT